MDASEVDMALSTAAPRPLPATEMLLRLRAEGNPIGPIVRGWARSYVGPGKLMFHEFVALRLYDRALYGKADLRAFIGSRVGVRICRVANVDPRRYGLFQNKVAATAILGAHGIPVVPTRAFFRKGIPNGRATLGETDALARFLLDPDNYPLFGKPASGLRSIGAISFAACDPSARIIFGADGRAVSADDIAAAITRRFYDGYLLQPRLAGAETIRAICGDRLTTLRVVTVRRREGPHLLRACWKIPTGTNIADNYWRAGNILVQVDPTTGRTGRAMTGTGPELREVDRHPDTGIVLSGIEVPNWDSVASAALDGAAAMDTFGYVGWDIAPVQGGACILEMNENPDPILPQLADRRGILDAEMRDFLKEQHATRTEFRRNERAFYRRMTLPARRSERHH